MENNLFCLICGNICDSTKDTIVNKPTKKGLLNILKAAETRQDEFSKNILVHKNSILSGINHFKFHTSCRRSYITEKNISCAKLMLPDSSLPSTSSNKQPRTRGTDSFSIRTMCLFCHRAGKKKREKLTSIQTGRYLVIIRSVSQTLTKKFDSSLNSIFFCI